MSDSEEEKRMKKLKRDIKDKFEDKISDKFSKGRVNKKRKINEDFDDSD